MTGKRCVTCSGIRYRGGGEEDPFSHNNQRGWGPLTSEAAKVNKRTKIMPEPVILIQGRNVHLFSNRSLGRRGKKKSEHLSVRKKAACSTSAKWKGGRDRAAPRLEKSPLFPSSARGKRRRIVYLLAAGRERVVCHRFNVGRDEGNEAVLLYFTGGITPACRSGKVQRKEGNDSVTTLPSSSAGKEKMPTFYPLLVTSRDKPRWKRTRRGWPGAFLPRHKKEKVLSTPRKLKTYHLRVVEEGGDGRASLSRPEKLLFWLLEDMEG